MLTLDRPEHFFESYLAFERVSGTLDNFLEAYRRIKKRTELTHTRHLKDLERLERDESVSEKKSKKRQREDDSRTSKKIRPIESLVTTSASIQAPAVSIPDTMPTMILRYPSFNFYFYEHTSSISNFALELLQKIPCL